MAAWEEEAAEEARRREREALRLRKKAERRQLRQQREAEAGEAEPADAERAQAEAWRKRVAECRPACLSLPRGLLSPAISMCQTSRSFST